HRARARYGTGTACAVGSDQSRGRSGDRALRRHDHASSRRRSRSSPLVRRATTGTVRGGVARREGRNRPQRGTQPRRVGGSVSYQAVIFDLGGVVFPSPFEAFDAYDHGNGLTKGTLRALIRRSSEEGAWAALERGELTMDEFVIAL